MVETGKTIAFFGVGQMGAPMIAQLAAAGHRVCAWNRTPDKARAVAGENVLAVEDPRAAVDGADIAISILSDGAAVLALVQDNDLAGEMREGAVFIDMSSTRPEEARKLAEVLAAGGVGFCDAPVSGGPPGAEAGTLAIMAGCDAALFERIAPVLSAMGRSTRLGPVGTGQLAKLANQLIVGAAIGAVAEAVLLVREGGGDVDAFRDALTGGYADSKVLQMHGGRMAAGDFAPRGRAALHRKDFRNILDEAEKLGLSLPMGDMLLARFTRLCDDLGGADLDHCALFLELLDTNKRT